MAASARRVPHAAPLRDLTVHFTVCDAHIIVTTPDPMLRDVVKRLYPAYATTAPATTRDAPLRIVLRPDAPGYVIETPWEPSRTKCVTLNDAVDACEFVLTRAFLDGCRGFLQLHGSGATIGGRGIIALGGSGAGKSSLALAWSIAGQPVLGDDVVFVDAAGRVSAFKRQFKVSAAALRAGGIDPASTPFWATDADEAWFDPGAGAGWAEPSPVDLVVLARFEPDAPVGIRELSRVEGLNALAHSRLATGCPVAVGFDRLVAMVRNARLAEVRFGSASLAAAELLRLVG